MSHQELFEKCLRVVKSCTTESQCDTAQKYVMLFFNRTKDFDDLRSLVDELNKQIDAIQNK
jgi:polyhydroxyalkanoate synthesis regulator phasin